MGLSVAIDWHMHTNFNNQSDMGETTPIFGEGELTIQIEEVMDT